ncbi:hypothetical protein [Legionella shakespearei]|uniref:Uncharacterized protein n=1 Tax=Legionella shakespearei DSM 23087 TaxID=1122169 RepID=A0A0W0YLV5_9GAMM|nr:hypothetical protein [Legionella shakespearei]KTD57872.1 hypothetical protein Lsha_2150 [Legionella shakespearei DSM 23087]
MNEHNTLILLNELSGKINNLVDMSKYDLQLLEKHSGGLNRKYPRYCPNFSIGKVTDLIKCIEGQALPFA